MHRQQTSAEYLTPRERCGAPHRKKNFPGLFYTLRLYQTLRSHFLCLSRIAFSAEAHQLNEPVERYYIFHHKLRIEHRERRFEPDNAHEALFRARALFLLRCAARGRSLSCLSCRPFMPSIRACLSSRLLSGGFILNRPSSCILVAEHEIMRRGLAGHIDSARLRLPYQLNALLC